MSYLVQIQENVWKNRLNQRQKIDPAKDQVKAMIPANVQSVIDVGCGDGSLLMELNAQKRVGVDISDEALKEAKKKKLSVKKIKPDEKLPFKDRSFEWTISCQVLMHVLDAKNFIREQLRITQKGFIINVPNALYWKYRLEFLIGKPERKFVGQNPHLRLYSYQLLKELIQTSGGKIVEEQYTGYPFAGLWPSLLATSFTFKVIK